MLLDTCVLSELYHASGSQAVKEAVNQYEDDDIYVSVLTLGEISKGIARLEEGRRRRDLAAWLLEIEHSFESRILDVDLQAAELWGQRTSIAATRGETVPPIDGLNAATAIRHNLVIMTRNSRHFECMGVEVLDPWKS